MIIHCRLSEFFYYSFFLLLFTTRILGLYEGNIIYSSVLVMSMLFFACSYMFTSKTVLSVSCDFLIMLFALISWRFSGEKGLLLFFAMMIGARAVSLEKLFKAVIMLSGSAYSVMVMLGSVGLINEYQNTLSYRPLIGYISRRSISPLQLNIFMEPYLVFMVMILYLIKGKGKKYVITCSGLLFVGLSYLFGYCITFSSFIIGIILLILNYYMSFKCKYNKFTAIVVQLLYLLSVLIGTFGSLLGNSSYGTGGTFARRFQIGRYYLERYAPVPWGQRIDITNPDVMPYGIHQSQLYLLLQCGIILFIVVNLLYHYALAKIVLNKDGTALAAILSFSILGIVEPLLFNLSFKNVGFIFVGKAYGYWLNSVSQKNKYLRKEVFLIPDKEIVISIPFIKSIFVKLRNTVMNKSVCIRLITAAIAVGICVAGITATRIPPKAYLFDRNIQNSVDGDSYYFTDQDVKDMSKDGVAVLGYKDMTTPVYKHVNMSPIYDYIRGIISSFVWSTLCVFMFMALFHKKNEKNVKNKPYLKE